MNKLLPIGLSFSISVALIGDAFAQSGAAGNSNPAALEFIVNDGNLSQCVAVLANAILKTTKYAHLSVVSAGPLYFTAQDPQGRQAGGSVIADFEFRYFRDPETGTLRYNRICKIKAGPDCEKYFELTSNGAPLLSLSRRYCSSLRDLERSMF